MLSAIAPATHGFAVRVDDAPKPGHARTRRNAASHPGAVPSGEHSALPGIDELLADLARRDDTIKAHGRFHWTFVLTGLLVGCIAQTGTGSGIDDAIDTALAVVLAIGGACGLYSGNIALAANGWMRRRVIVARGIAMSVSPPPPRMSAVPPHAP